jgi:alcohol dehydrogenase (cytochrome c)
MTGARDSHRHSPARHRLRTDALHPASAACLALAIIPVFAGSQAPVSSPQRSANSAALVSTDATSPGDTTGLIDVTQAGLLQNPVPADWLSYNGDYTGRRFSGLTQITPANVSRLAVQWVFHPRDVSPLEVTPVVDAGVMFVTSANDAYALDAATGKQLWHHARALSEGLVDDAAVHHNRGLAILGTRIYMETDNAHLLCLDARSGSLIWDVAYATGNKNYGATSAPLIVKNNVIVGTSGGDDGVRGFLAAFDADTGKEKWRFWTIPSPGEKGSESWPGDAYLHGGGTTWMPGTYDPTLNTLYWGTGNPSPDYDGGRRPGDDLYTSSLLALDPDTGALKWYFQYSPHDLYDYDAVQTPVLVDANYQGKPRKLIVSANRNGFLYILDRTNGKFLFARQFAIAQTWARGIDAKGRPISAGLIPNESGVAVCPANGGATNWYSPSYDPQTHLFYFRSYEACALFKSKSEPFEEGSTYYSTGSRVMEGSGEGYINAFDLDTLDFAWRNLQIGRYKGWGGVMTTAAGLLAYGDDAENFVILDARSGKPLWHFNVGQLIHASPMSYAVNGKQYFAVAAGSDIFSFALP